MDFTALNLVYANPFYPQNFLGIQQHQIFHHPNYVVNSIGPYVPLNSMYRLEDGSGDARGSLLLENCNDDSYCEFAVVEGDAHGQGEAAAPINAGAEAIAECGAQVVNGERKSDTTLTTNVTTEDISTTPSCSSTGSSNNVTNELNMNVPSLEFSNQAAVAMNISMMTMANRQSADGTQTIIPTAYPLMPFRDLPYIRFGDDKYILEPETVFVLGMRLNVTKNDIIVYFSKMGVIDTEEEGDKPKIFVYKNKLTGKSKGEATVTYVSPFMAQMAINCLNGSKFMGQMITVLPAYKSKRKGNGIRFRYPRHLKVLGTEFREYRQRKWKPASDNWFCMACRNSNFVWRSNCNRCHAKKSECAAEPFPNTSPYTSPIRRWRPQKNDWTCGFCFNKNFWYREKCNRCRAPKMESPTKSESEKWELVLSGT